MPIRRVIDTPRGLVAWCLAAEVRVSPKPSSPRPPPGKEMKLTNHEFDDAVAPVANRNVLKDRYFLLPKILAAVNIFPLFHKGYQSCSFPSDIIGNYY